MTDTQFPGTGLLDPPPGDNDPELNLALRAKRNGMSEKDYTKLRYDGIMLTGRVLRWNSADYDRAFIALALIVEEVWGERQ